MIVEHIDAIGLLLDVRSGSDLVTAIAMTETPASSGRYLATVTTYDIWYVFLRTPTPTTYTDHRGASSVTDSNLVTINTSVVKGEKIQQGNSLTFYNGGTYTKNIVTLDDAGITVSYLGTTGTFKLESNLKVDLLSLTATGTTTGFSVPVAPYTTQTECGFWSIRDSTDTILVEGVAIFKYGAT